MQYLFSPIFLCEVIEEFVLKRMMKFVGMCVKALPFPHFHEPNS